MVGPCPHQLPGIAVAASPTVGYVARSPSRSWTVPDTSLRRVHRLRGELHAARSRGRDCTSGGTPPFRADTIGNSLRKYRCRTIPRCHRRASLLTDAASHSGPTGQGGPWYATARLDHGGGGCFFGGGRSPGGRPPPPRRANSWGGGEGVSPP